MKIKSWTIFLIYKCLQKIWISISFRIWYLSGIKYTIPIPLNISKRYNKTVKILVRGIKQRPEKNFVLKLVGELIDIWESKSWSYKLKKELYLQAFDNKEYARFLTKYGRRRRRRYYWSRIYLYSKPFNVRFRIWKKCRANKKIMEFKNIIRKEARKHLLSVTDPKNISRRAVSPRRSKVKKNVKGVKKRTNIDKFRQSRKKTTLDKSWRKNIKYFRVKKKKFCTINQAD